MQNFAIGMSGYEAARRALDTIGNNIANSATEGYHRQRVLLEPAYSSQVGNMLLGGGVKVGSVTRLVDNLLEQEILRQDASYEHLSRELGTLSTVENTFGELTAAGGLNELIDRYFNSLKDLSLHPDDNIWQNNTVAAAEAMAGKFRSLGHSMTELQSQLRLEADNVAQQANTLINNIGSLNDKIKSMTMAGKDPNNLQDQRDACIGELNKLVGTQTTIMTNGVVNVSVGGIPVVISSQSTEIMVGFNDSGLMGVAAKGSTLFDSNITGGAIGGLLSLKNDLLTTVHTELDQLASAFINKTNQLHVQGVSSKGPFSELDGWLMTDENISSIDPPVADGEFFIRLTNTTTGEITRHAVSVDAANDTTSDVAANIDGIAGLSASVVNSRLRIQADPNYKFDFSPAILPDPANSMLTGNVPAIELSGVYDGDATDTYTFTVTGTGSVGNGTLSIDVIDGDGKLLNSLNVGEGYAAGDILNVANGVSIKVGMGDLNINETFEAEVYSMTDETGVLAGLGMNVLFTGGFAAEMQVSSAISADPSLFAGAIGSDMTDNHNILRMINLGEDAMSELGDISPSEYYKKIVAHIGQDISIKQMQQENSEVVIQNLLTQQGDISGVDINEEAAMMVIYEQMFHAMAKFMNATNESLKTLMTII